jgi:nitrate reductase NapE component
MLHKIITMDKDQIIQATLEYLVKNSPVELYKFIEFTFPELTSNAIEINTIIAVLRNEDFIEPVGNTGDFFKINPLGKKIAETVGWISYRNEKELRKENERKVIDLRTQKTKTEITILKWQKLTFWPLFIIAIVGGVCGVVSLLMQLIK